MYVDWCPSVRANWPNRNNSKVHEKFSCLPFFLPIFISTKAKTVQRTMSAIWTDTCNYRLRKLSAYADRCLPVYYILVTRTAITSYEQWQLLKNYVASTAWNRPRDETSGWWNVRWWIVRDEPFGDETSPYPPDWGSHEQESLTISVS